MYFDLGITDLGEHAVVPNVSYVRKMRHQCEALEHCHGTRHLCEGNSCGRIEAFLSLYPAQLCEVLILKFLRGEFPPV